MSGVAWSALMRAGLQDLGLSPAQFWDLTPAELMLMLGTTWQSTPLSRARFEELTRNYPDIRDGREA